MGTCRYRAGSARLECARRYLDGLDPHNARTVAFGSVVRGDSPAESDTDLLIVGDERPSLPFGTHHPAPAVEPLGKKKEKRDRRREGRPLPLSSGTGGGGRCPDDDERCCKRTSPSGSEPPPLRQAIGCASAHRARYCRPRDGAPRPRSIRPTTLVGFRSLRKADRDHVPGSL
ncbi:nucleotidyltransferase domain-containing protein [Pelomicrobium sp.]|uniref:nucleotidyltransferase domain-containing protein n=1 Tax=Pelomicrobium sp. TaxID=2815319 RepID=UPI003FA6AA6D